MESVYNAAPIGKHPDGLCLLSLDGGGVRGLSILYILRAIMARLNVERQEANLPPVRPCEVFDLIGGTSTGGLIAIMLGRLEMDVEECIDTYSGLSQKIFSQKQNRFGFGWKGDLKGRFSAENLEEAISKVVSDKGFNNSDPLDNGKPPGCRVMVCACARETQGTTRLRSYNLPGKPAPKVPPSIVGAARATSAATRFFDPVTIGNRTYVDGALSANNPIDEVEDEAASIWCPTTRDLKPHVKCFISIGTGNPGKHSIQDHSALKFLSETLVQMVTETEKTANKFASRWREQIEKKVYFRFNVQQGLQDVSLEAYSKEGIIEATTEEYLEESEVALRLGHCVQGLIDKQSVCIPDFT
ncbi:phospholipase [Lojkania enalia]|uniref:Phospholipase n=1 Tax=Lojkania enalia TaxID=147567 RepID=A0A9P4NAB6_9PLEO|nr:phospholipase [Didymosphaeria enalia]